MESLRRLQELTEKLGKAEDLIEAFSIFRSICSA